LGEEIQNLQFLKCGCLAYCHIANQTLTVPFRLELTKRNENSSICFCSNASKL